MATLKAQVVARMVVQAGAFARDNSIVSCPLEAYGMAPGTSWKLEEVQGNKRKEVAMQLEPGRFPRIWWVLTGKTPAGAQRVFELSVIRLVTAIIPVMQVTDRNGNLLLQEGTQQILQYNYNTVYPPSGVDTLYKRSGFIHPVWAPNGAVLTNIFPEGHYHHMGIWNPWTHTSFEGRVVDFWNLQKKEGTVRFTGFLSKTQGNIWAGFKARQEHVAFERNGKEKAALDEVWDVRAYTAGANSSKRIWDFASTISCATDSALLLLQYRYGGGLCFRATAAWTSTTSQVLTSEGKSRKDADSTRARWVKISGNTPQGNAGLLIMNSAANYNSPQPLRVWPENAERGELMLNYSPTKMTSWLLTYGNEYTQKYRVMVFEGDMTEQAAEGAWQDFAHPPVVTLSFYTPPDPQNVQRLKGKAAPGIPGAGR